MSAEQVAYSEDRCERGHVLDCCGNCGCDDTARPPPCGLCKQPVTGFAVIGDIRYCHGDSDPAPTCYEVAQWRESASGELGWVDDAIREVGRVPSETGLREALEALVAEHWDWKAGQVLHRRLREILAAHPAPSAETERAVTPADIAEQREKGWPDWHPEDYCHRCGQPNMTWYTTWEVWRSVTAAWAAETGREGICCPQCFAAMAEDQGLYRPGIWALIPWSDHQPEDYAEWKQEHDAPSSVPAASDEIEAEKAETWDEAYQAGADDMHDRMLGLSTGRPNPYKEDK